MNDGVFSGKKWALAIFNPVVSDARIMASQIGAPHLKVIIRWEVRVIVYGAAPQRFKVNREVKVSIKVYRSPFIF